MRWKLEYLQVAQAKESLMELKNTFTDPTTASGRWRGILVKRLRNGKIDVQRELTEMESSE